MKKLILAVLLLSLPSWATIAFVNSKQQAGGTTGSQGSGSMALTAGNVELVVVAFYNGQSNTPHVTSVTDSQSDTYSNLVTYQPANNVFVEVWFTTIATTNATGSSTVNYTPTGTGTSAAVEWVQYSGVLQVNTNNPQTGTSASNVTSASISLTTNDNNNFVFGAFAVHPANALTVSGCTGRGQNTNNGGGTANLWDCDNTSATPASVSVGMTFTAAVWSGAAIELCTVNPCVSAGGGRIRHQVITGE